MKWSLMLCVCSLFWIGTTAYAERTPVYWVNDGNSEPPLCYWSDPELGLLSHVVGGCNLVGRTDQGDRIFKCTCRVCNLPPCTADCVECVRNADGLEYCIDDACRVNSEDPACPQCSAAGDCARNETCVQGRCVPVHQDGEPCFDSSDCLSTSVCSSAHNNTCQPRCAKDSQCQQNQICAPINEASVNQLDQYVCRPGNCRTHSDCGGGSVCINYLCAQILPRLCESKKDCPSEAVCHSFGDKGSFCVVPSGITLLPDGTYGNVPVYWP